MFSSLPGLLRSVTTAESSLVGRAANTNGDFWGYDQMRGLLVEISASGLHSSLTASARLIWEAQNQREPVAWVSCGASHFFPPDFERNGIDLSALLVIRAGGVLLGGRTTDRLVRSGAFGLVILDMGSGQQLSLPLLSRVASLCKKKNTATVCLTDKSRETASLGAVVSLRTEALRENLGKGRFRYRVRTIKDKRRGPGRENSELVFGPPGLR